MNDKQRYEILNNAMEQAKKILQDAAELVAAPDDEEGDLYPDCVPALPQ